MGLDPVCMQIMLETVGKFAILGGAVVFLGGYVVNTIQPYKRLAEWAVILGIGAVFLGMIIK